VPPISAISQHCKTRGLRWVDEEADRKYVRFFGFVQRAAASLGKVFYAHADENNLTETDRTECCDISGWLVPATETAEFERQWNVVPDDDIDDRFWDMFVIARWSGDPDSPAVIFE